ncbi:MAG: sigma-70 family RNA polymerase sigma factor [Acidobacteriota bacterium]
MADYDPISGKTDEELGREARAGSRRSFEELACRYRRRLFVYVRARAGSDEDAEDLVQDTFLKLYRNIAAYDPAFRFSTWLYTSAGRLAIDAYRKKAAARGRLAGARIEDAADQAAKTEDAGGAAGASGAWDAARALGGDRFRALWLRYGEDMSIAEIAAVIGRSPLAVRVLLHRARTSLAGRLGPEAGAAARPRTGAPRAAARS